MLRSGGTGLPGYGLIGTDRIQVLSSDMKIAFINICDYGSTGKIMLQLAKEAAAEGNETVCFTRNWWDNRGSEGNVYFGYRTEHALHHVLGYVTGSEGSFSVLSTMELIRKLDEFGPDVIHLHNLHGWFICLPILFDYIKKKDIRVIWTFHDCWPFTGHCPYFDFSGCSRWTEGCGNCPVYKEYPESLFDNSAKMYRRKKSWFSGVRDMTIVCPSEWLAGLVRMSFLAEYDVKVIHNGIDTAVFRRTESDFRERYGIRDDDKILLGVASVWEPRKGLDVFPELDRRLGSGYRTVLVGIDSAQKADIPGNIICIDRTSNQKELAEIYSAADVFVNPTREDNYPTVNLEAISCGTPVVTFRTGGSPESVGEGCGIVVPKDDTDAVVEAVRTVCRDASDHSSELASMAESFDSMIMTGEYLKLYGGQ